MVSAVFKTVVGLRRSSRVGSTPTHSRQTMSSLTLLAPAATGQPAPGESGQRGSADPACASLHRAHPLHSGLGSWQRREARVDGREAFGGKPRLGGGGGLPCRRQQQRADARSSDGSKDSRARCASPARAGARARTKRGIERMRLRCHAVSISSAGCPGAFERCSVIAVSLHGDHQAARLRACQGGASPSPAHYVTPREFRG